MSRLTERECLERLRNGSIGRLVFVVDGWPVALPVNYVVVDRDIVVRTDSGSALTALADAAQVGFEIDGYDSLYRSGWSVLVHALARQLDADERDRLIAVRQLRSWADGPKRHWIRLVPVQMTGRVLARAWEYPHPIPNP